MFILEKHQLVNYQMQSVICVVQVYSKVANSKHKMLTC